MPWRPAPQQIRAAWASSPQPPRKHPRMVWIVFDELSYDQLFEHRAHDLNLPNFDALRSQSTLFTDVQPIGIQTVKIIPSLLTGHASTTSGSPSATSSRFTTPACAGGIRSTDSQTVFAAAHQQGWRTAAVGWYNPYCTIYGDAIDDCYFMNLDRIDGLMAQRDPFWRNTLSPSSR